jgi:pseudaminic acid synthase
VRRFSVVKLGAVEVGCDHRPFIIAEMSGNHGGSLDRALAIVDAAAEAGASAIKLQTYTADTMTIDVRRDEFVIQDPGNLWAGSSLYDLYAKASTPWEWHEPIFERARQRGLEAFSSPFDGSAVEFLESLGAPMYKIASLENTDLPLIRAAAATGKPLIISTGLATIAELGDAVAAARAAGCRDLVLLKCTSSYPALPESANLLTIPHLRELFGCEVGLSDHTLGIGVAIASVALGATVIEKHLTMEKGDVGVDSAFSLDPPELDRLVRESEAAWKAVGSVRYGPTEAEVATLKRRRSLYVVRDVAASERLTLDNVRAIRPGYGLPPGMLDAVLGRRVSRDVPRGTPVTWDLLV